MNNAFSGGDPPGRPAFAYLRVSGQGQEDGDGWARQRKSIDRFAAVNGYQITEEFRDIQTGKDNWELRAGWTAMLARLNGCRTIIVEKLDRVAREVLVSELIISDLKKRGVTLLTSTGEDSSDESPERIMFRQLLSVFASYERASIVLKLRGARERSRAEHGRCEGRKPYGHRPGEAATLARIHDLHRDGLSAETIAEHLNEQHVSPRYGELWRGPTIRKILARLT